LLKQLLTLVCFEMLLLGQTVALSNYKDIMHRRVCSNHFGERSINY